MIALLLYAVVDLVLSLNYAVSTLVVVLGMPDAVPFPRSHSSILVVDHRLLVAAAPAAAVPTVAVFSDAASLVPPASFAAGHNLYLCGLVLDSCSISCSCSLVVVSVIDLVHLDVHLYCYCA